jgi:hypothetical protein
LNVYINYTGSLTTADVKITATVHPVSTWNTVFIIKE